ncbi:MAG: 2-succinyl-5-enolpyruvyl-6-hydroxy-3-cyclohexene-1-carboxylic-acid synthase [Opitutae bacterium]|nr:2-succinyl-5-enolpyruvyl-6-hydroxy-3-cyclohexene-1-carboxylic-acid synthase [Opitutae bacterium]
MRDFAECRNFNALWCAVFAETLKNCGVRSVVASPGSRSTPLAAAFSHTRGIEVVPVLDERSAGFFALGLAKSTHFPVVLFCSSGTAVANYLPAVVEAKMSRTPLIVVSADRPPEMQDCHAGQTIPQRGIFSAFPVFEKNCVPENSQQSVDEAFATACDAVENALLQSAPVHVNVGFREPLSPHIREAGLVVGNFSVRTQPQGWWRRGLWRQEAPFPVVAAAARDEILGLFASGKRGMVVAGTVPPGQDDSFNAALLAARFSAPILADATHPLRLFPPAGDNLVARYDKILRDAAARHKGVGGGNNNGVGGDGVGGGNNGGVSGENGVGGGDELAPDFVVQIGTLPESKFLRAWLAKLKVPVFLFNYCGDNTDALHREMVVNTGARLRECFPEVFFSHHKGVGGGNNLRHHQPEASSLLQKNFLRAWKVADASANLAAAEFFSAQIGATTNPTEPEIARFICENVPEPETMVFVANGMPVRDMNAFCPVGCRFWAFHNRGANGIDGTLSTALGVAHGCMEQTILYTGDLSLLHDVNGFLIAPHFRGNLTIVLQNDGGGNIFRNLPIAESGEPDFEKLWIMPQRADFKKLAEAYGADYAFAQTLGDLARALEKFRSRAGIHVVEMRPDGAESAKLRRRI